MLTNLALVTFQVKVITGILFTLFSLYISVEYWLWDDSVDLHI